MLKNAEKPDGVMVVELGALREICERAGVRGRAREVLELLAQSVPAEEIGRRLGIAATTVYVHAHKARKKIAGAELRSEEREFHRFVLHEAMPGPAPSNPPTPLFRVKGPGYGERVRVNAGPPVTVDDLVRALER